jgi:hypothetical protein
MTDEYVQSVRQVGQILSFEVEFGCFVERRKDNKRRVRYEARINGLPTSATFYVEDDRASPALSDSEVEAAVAYIDKFLRDGITDGIETVFQEAHQLTHNGQNPNKKFLTAFLRHISDQIKEASTRRMQSGVAESKRKQWLKFEASAKSHHRTDLLKEYQSDYKTLYDQYTRRTHQTGHDQFARDVWDGHEREAYAGKSANFLKYARQVAAGSLTPAEAAREWLSEDMKIPSSTLERRYIRKPFGKRRKTRLLSDKS